MFLVVVAVLVGVAAVLYVVIVGDGTYFGRRFVRFLYDRLASRWSYPTNPRHRLIDREDLLPLLLPLVAGDARARVLDVATGTGRVPGLLEDEASFIGTVFGCDLSSGMLARAVDGCSRSGPAGPGPSWIQAAAECLPFAAESFSAVTCVEALMNFGRPRRALAEMARVTVGGGHVIVTKRSDGLARLLPGKDFTRRRLARALETEGFSGISFSRYRGSVRGSQVAIATKQAPHATR